MSASYCNRTGMRCYGNANEARAAGGRQKAAGHAISRRRKKLGHSPKVFSCEHCGGWHLGLTMSPQPR